VHCGPTTCSWPEAQQAVRRTAAMKRRAARTGQPELLARLRQVPARLGVGRLRHFSHLRGRPVSAAHAAQQPRRCRAFWLRASVTNVGQSVSPRNPLRRAP
jgi:hypothetical protein